MRRIVCFLLIIPVFLLLIFAFMDIGNKNDAAFPDPEEKAIPEEVSGDADEEYILTIEGERLNLYFGDEKNAPFESEMIRKEVFPKEDIERLEEGMVFKNAEDAYSAMENFVN